MIKPIAIPPPAPRFAELLAQLMKLYPAFRRGRHVPFDLQFLRIVNYIERHPGPNYGPLFQPMVARAMRHRDSQLLVRLRRLIDLGIPLYHETVACAHAHWREGVQVLRAGNEDVPLAGLSLVEAYLINDDSAYDREQPPHQLAEDARDLVAFVKGRGGDITDAISFIKRCDLSYVNPEVLR